MPYESNERIRRELLERLRNIGMCPDLKNDEAAVRAICLETGASTNEVAEELTRMRMETGQSIFKSMGVSNMPHDFLASMAASRDTLSSSLSFHQAYAERLKMTQQELVNDLNSPVQAQQRQRSPSSLARYERDIEREDMRAPP